MMHNRKNLYRSGIILLTALSILVYPLASGNYNSGSTAFAQGPLPTLPPSNVTVTPPIGTPVVGATPIPTVESQDLSIYIDGDMLVIGLNSYPIGDSFFDPSGLPMGAKTTGLKSDFGFAEILGIEDYVVIWIINKDGYKEYLIVSVYDELFAGHPGIDDGFDDYLQLLLDTEEAMTWALGGEAGGVIGAAILTQLELCAPTGGTTCVSALITFGLAALGGLATLLYNYIFKYVPQVNNLQAKFEGIDLVRP